jgi:hypothetical protein
MRNFKVFGALLAVLALSAIGAVTASAQFTYSAPGSFTGTQEATQVFKAGSTVTCKKADTTGTLENLNFRAQEVTVHYSECTVDGFNNAAHATDATYDFTATPTMEEETAGENWDVHLKNTVTITPTVFGSSACTITVTPQTLNTVDYTNVAGGGVTVNPTVTGISYHSTGGLCGSSGTAGTYSGSSIVNGTGGQTLSVDQ